MNNNKSPKITQLNNDTPLTNEEKNIINRYDIKKEEELSKTTQFKILNKKNKNNKSINLPSLKKENIIELPKRKDNLYNTIKLKISDLRKEIDNQNIKDYTEDKKNTNSNINNKRKSLYDTIVIKLDDLINKKNAIKTLESKKVTNIENTKINKKKFNLLKPRNITRKKNIKLNVESEEFGRQLYNLNKIALNNLSVIKNKKARKYSSLSKLEKINHIHISEDNYIAYQQKMKSFAINKLYYKFAPKETKKYKLYRFSVLTVLIIFICSSLFVVNWFVEGSKIKSLSNSVTKQTDVNYINGGDIVNITDGSDDENWHYLNTPLASVDFDNVSTMNSDTIGWLIVNNTNVNYPVVQTVDNDYYLNHSFDKSFNYAGWIFADFRNTFNSLNKNTVIYGHNRKDGIMFGSLMNALEKDWYSNFENQLIQFSTPAYDSMWQIFSVYTIEAESYYITTDFSSNDSFVNFTKTIKERSIYDFNININNNDKILTLSTCYNDSEMRTVIHAKLVKIKNRT